MKTNRVISKAILVAIGLPLAVSFAPVSARRAYSTAEAEIGRYGSSAVESSAPARPRKKLKKRVVHQKVAAVKSPDAIKTAVAAAVPQASKSTAVTAVQPVDTKAITIDAIRSDSGKSIAKQDLVKPLSTKPEAAKQDAASPDAAKQDLVKQDAASPDAAKPDSIKPDAAKPDAASPDVVKQDVVLQHAADDSAPAPLLHPLSAADTTTLAKAKSLTDSGQYDNALKVCDQLLQSNPDSTAVMLQKAEISARKKNYTLTNQIIAKISRETLIKQEQSFELSQLALVYSLIEDRAEAAQTIQDALKISPFDNAILARAVEYLGASGQYDQAVQIAQEILNKRKDSALSHALAIMQARSNHLSDALETVSHEFDNNNSAEMQELRAEVYAAAGEYGEALAIYTTLAKEHRQEVFYPSSKAEMLRKLGRFEEALTQCNSALQLATQDPWLLSCKIKILQELKQYDAAHKVVKELIAVSPNDPQNYIASASVYESQRDFGSALVSSEEGLRKLGANDDLQELRIRAIWDLGRLDVAASELDKLLSQDPDNDQFKRLKLRFETFKCNLDSAQKIADSLTASSGKTQATEYCLAQFYMAKRQYKQAIDLLDAALRDGQVTDPDRAAMQLLAVAGCFMAGDHSIALERLDEYNQEAQSTVEGAWPSPVFALLMHKISLADAAGKINSQDHLASLNFYEAIRTLSNGNKTEAAALFTEAAKVQRNDSVESVVGANINQAGVSPQLLNTLLLALGVVGALAVLAGLIVMIKKYMAKRAEMPVGPKDPEGFLDDDHTKVWTPSDLSGANHASGGASRGDFGGRPTGQFAGQSAGSLHDDQSASSADAASAATGGAYISGSPSSNRNHNRAIYSSVSKSKVAARKDRKSQKDKVKEQRKGLADDENPQVSAISEQLPEANELSPESSGARRKYFASFAADAPVADIWNNRISHLDENGQASPLVRHYELKDDMNSYGASMPPIIPGVPAAHNPAWSGPVNADMSESQQQLILGKFNVNSSSTDLPRPQSEAGKNPGDERDQSS